MTLRAESRLRLIGWGIAAGFLLATPARGGLPEVTCAEFAEGNCRYVVDLVGTRHFGNRLRVRVYAADSLLSSHAIFLDFDLYRLEIGDVDGDGRRDICLGVIKPTRFDPVERRRLFCYWIDQGYIRPLWLGTYLGRELVDFQAVELDRRSYVRTLEIDAGGLFCVGEYRWTGFGFEWKRYLGERLERDEALGIFGE